MQPAGRSKWPLTARLRSGIEWRQLLSGLKQYLLEGHLEASKDLPTRSQLQKHHCRLHSNWPLTVRSCLGIWWRQPCQRLGSLPSRDGLFLPPNFPNPFEASVCTRIGGANGAPQICRSNHPLIQSLTFEVQIKLKTPFRRNLEASRNLSAGNPLQKHNFRLQGIGMSCRKKTAHAAACSASWRWLGK